MLEECILNYPLPLNVGEDMFDAVVPYNSDTNVTLTAVASFLRTT